MKYTFFLSFILLPLVLPAQIVTDKTLPAPVVVKEQEIERKLHLNLWVSNTLFCDTAITSFAGKRNFVSFGTGLIFFTPETRKIRPFVNAEFCRYTQTYDKNELPEIKISNFNLSAGLNIPFELSESQFFYVTTALNHGEFNNTAPGFYSRYFGVNVGLGFEKRIKTDVMFFVEAGMNNNRALKKYLKQHEPYNLNTFCLKAGFRL